MVRLAILQPFLRLELRLRYGSNTYVLAGRQLRRLIRTSMSALIFFLFLTNSLISPLFPAGIRDCVFSANGIRRICQLLDRIAVLVAKKSHSHRIFTNRWTLAYD